MEIKKRKKVTFEDLVEVDKRLNAYPLPSFPQRSVITFDDLKKASDRMENTPRNSPPLIHKLGGSCKTKNTLPKK